MSGDRTLDRTLASGLDHDAAPGFGRRLDPRAERLLGGVLRVVSAAFGVLWLLAAASKAISPQDPYEFTARVLPAGPVAATALAALAATEAGLGVLMLTGRIRGFVPTLVVLGGFTGVLLWTQHRIGGRIPCGCFSTFAASSVEDALSRNYGLLGIAAAGFALSVVLRRGAARAGASGVPAR